MRQLLILASLGAAALAALPDTAAAQGFSFNELSACAMGRGGAGIASPCADGSSIYFNPAGIAGAPATFSIGATGIAPVGSYRNAFTGLRTDLNGSANGVPTLYITRPIGDQVTVGLGVFTPYWNSLEWPATSLGRFLGYRTAIQAVHIQPTVAVKLGKHVRVGGGVNLALTTAQFNQRQDLARLAALPGVTYGQAGVAAGTDFADAEFRGSKLGYGFHVGVLIEPIEQVSIGARYLSSISTDIEGTINYTRIATNLVVPANIPNPANPAQTAIPVGTPIDATLSPLFLAGQPFANRTQTWTLNTPDQLQFGVALTPTRSVRLLADGQWTKWSGFVGTPTLGAVTTVVPVNYSDTWGWRFGAECTAVKDITFRLGYATTDAASSATSVTAVLPEASRQTFSGGIGAQLSRTVHMDLAYAYLRQPDRVGRSGDGFPLAAPVAATNDGLFSFQQHLFAATFAFAF